LSITPPVHVYVDAPLPVSVTRLPLQIVVAVLLAVTGGSGFTVTVTLLVFVQPFASVPVTVYVVVADGVTVMVEPETGPGIHEYVLAPLAESIAGVPSQIVTLPFVLTGGAALMVIARLVGALDPQVLSAVTEAVPDVEPNVTFTVVVPCPELMVVPAGNAQV
jgi:hypothetical protein